MNIERFSRAPKNTPESHAHRVIGRIGTNPITWLQYKVDHATDASPETLAHIRGLFRKLRAKKGPLKSLDDDTAEREYVRIAYRLNFMRIQERLMAMKVTDRGYHAMSKTLGIYAAATLKFKSDNGKQKRSTSGLRTIPSAATGQAETGDDDS